MNILVTGGTGSLGTALVPQLIKDGHDVTVLSRDPHRQNALRAIAPEASFVLGDVCDTRLVRFAVKGQDAVIHAAALKHVDIGEQNVGEYIRVNVMGSKSVVEACVDENVPTALLISSDKAVDPINLYGKTKSVAEDLFVTAGYGAVRYGNVVSSRGSFLSVWEEKSQSGKKIVLRTPSPTRFFLSMDGAVSLVLQTVDLMSKRGHNGIFIPKHLWAFSIEEAAKMFFHEDEIVRTDLLPGEKQHEVLLSKNEVAYDVPTSLVIAEVEKGHGEFSDKYCSGTCPQIVGTELGVMLEDIVGPSLLKRMWREL